MEKFLKSLGFNTLTAEELEVMLPTLIIGAILLLIVFLLIFDRIENARFNAWLERNSIYDTPLKPWRTIVPWHRTGSRWYEARTEGPMHYGVKNLTKRYGSFVAVDNLSLVVKKGEFMGLLGPNGSGKSTTLKSITGLVTPTNGEIFINGIDARKHREAMTHVGCVIETPES